MEQKLAAATFVRSLDHGLKVGDHVVDRIAQNRGWPDVEGIVEQVDNSMIKIRYSTGRKRWKMYTFLTKK